MTLELRMAKLNTGVAQRRLFRRVWLLCAVIWWCICVCRCENVLHRLAFDISIGALASSVMDWTAIRYIKCTSLVWIESNLNADRYIFYKLRLEVAPRLRGFPNAIFQQDIARPHAARHVPWCPWYLITVLATRFPDEIVSTVTHWKHLVMDYWETGPPFLAS